MELKTSIRVKVRFSEVDAIRMVWHGNYVRYLEDAREEFGRQFALEYMHIFHSGYYAPVFDMQLRYHQVATIDDELVVTIVYKPCKGGKLMFDYEIHRVSDDALILTASTIQLFTTISGEFEPSCPQFYAKWKEEHGVNCNSK